MQWFSLKKFRAPGKKDEDAADEKCLILHKVQTRFNLETNAEMFEKERGMGNVRYSKTDVLST